MYNTINIQFYLQVKKLVNNEKYINSYTIINRFQVQKIVTK